MILLMLVLAMDRQHSRERLVTTTTRWKFNILGPWPAAPIGGWRRVACLFFAFGGTVSK